MERHFEREIVWEFREPYRVTEIVHSGQGY
jgi:hypothetical protein